MEQSGPEGAGKRQAEREAGLEGGPAEKEDGRCDGDACRNLHLREECGSGKVGVVRHKRGTTNLEQGERLWCEEREGGAAGDS